MNSVGKPGLWEVGNNGAGKRIWFVWRLCDPEANSVMEVYSSTSGNYRRYKTGAAARKVAEKLNAKSL